MEEILFKIIVILIEKGTIKIMPMGAKTMLMEIANPINLIPINSKEMKALKDRIIIIITVLAVIKVIITIQSMK